MWYKQRRRTHPASSNSTHLSLALLTAAMVYRTPALGIGAFFVVAGFICLLVAFTTNQWIVIQVNRENLAISSSNTALGAFTRFRGIFKECFENEQETRASKYPREVLNPTRSFVPKRKAILELLEFQCSLQLKILTKKWLEFSS